MFWGNSGWEMSVSHLKSNVVQFYYRELELKRKDDVWDSCEKNVNGWHGPCRIRQGPGENPGKHQHLRSKWSKRISQGHAHKQYVDR